MRSKSAVGLGQDLVVPYMRPWVIGLVAAAALLASTARAVDVDTGEFVAAPSGTTASLVYYQRAQRSRMYSDGKQALDNAQLESDVGIFRLVHYRQLGPWLWAPQILVPFGSLRANGNLAGLGKESSLADIILAAPAWVVNEAKASRYLALVPYLWVPVGQYDNEKALNLGEHRWKGNLQAGYSQGVTEWLALDAAADVTFYGRNNKFGASAVTMKQAPSFQFQGDLAYLWSKTGRLALGISYETGGETTVDGVAQKDALGTLKAGITAAFWADGHNQLLFGVGRDLSVKNGLAEDFRFSFRWLHVL